MDLFTHSGISLNTSFQRSTRIDNEKEFARIYKNTMSFVKENKFLDIDYAKNVSVEETIYEK